jgi:HK97 family phage major capsid protein
MSKEINLVDAFKKENVDLAEGQETLLNTLSKSINEALKDKETTFETALKNAIGTLEKDDNGKEVSLMTQLKNIAEKLEKVSETQLGKFSETEKYQLKKMVKEKHQDIVDAVKNRKPLDFTFKIAAMHMTNNGTVTNAEGLDYPTTDNFMVDSEIAKIRYPENFLLNVIPNMQVAKVPQQVIKPEQAPKEGAAALVAEGAVKPLIQFKFVRTTTARKKYAGRIEWTEEFEMDYEALFREILRMFQEEVVRVWQAGLLAEIISNATSYVSSVLDGTFVAPDNGLAIIAGQSQLNALNYYPNVVLMNPADIVATMYQQDSEGNLKNVPYMNVATGTIGGMRLVSSNLIEQGTAIIMDSSIYNEIHSDFILREGQYADQFIENEYTAIGEVFSILSVAERNLVGSLELDLDAVKAALTEAIPSV